MAKAAAQARAERLNFHIIATFSARRACIGVGMGERAPAGAARAPMELVRITETLPPKTAGGKPSEIDITQPGFHTARRRLPLVLSRMAERDARRVAAERYANAAEKVGSVAGASAEVGKTDGGAATNDGGVTTRILHAGTIRAVEAVLAKAEAALVPKSINNSYRRQAITARALMDAVCLESRDIKSILVRSGWSGQRRDVATLSRAAEECLEDMARALGLISDDAPRILPPV